MQPSSAHVSYDEIPYHNVALPLTHPDHLAVIATLFGMEPAPVRRCRVLELGCAEGGNLIPMAYALPGARFLGIDLSERQVAAGQDLIAQLGLENIELRAANIGALDDDLGEFDYIIAYGIYSWVPPAVQQRIMAICRRSLAPQGVALISYNTYPGWHVRAAVRDLMRFHSHHFADPQRRAAQARAALDFLVQATGQVRERSHDLDLYHQILAQEQAVLADKPDFYLVHEHLEEQNSALYFHEFVERAAEHQLQYLGDARFASMLPSALPDEVARQIVQIAPHRVAYEQYSDFVLRRSFRQTLLCHAEAQLESGRMAERIAGLEIQATTELLRGEDGILRAHGRNGAIISLRTPLLMAAMTALAVVAPRPLGFQELLEIARAGSGLPPSDDDPGRLCAALLNCYGVEVVELRSYTPPFAVTPGERPRASALARLQVGHGRGVATLLHESVAPGRLESRLLPLLDGSRDLAALAAAIRPQLDDPPPHAELTAMITQGLRALAHFALLEDNRTA